MKTNLSFALQKFREFAEAHDVIKTYYCGPDLTNIDSDDMDYPLMWIQDQGLNINFSQGLMTFSVPVYMLDRVNEDDSNREEVLNSTSIMMRDFYVYFRTTDCSLNFYFQKSGTANRTEDSIFEDVLSGYTMNLSMNIMEDHNPDTIPGLENGL